MRRFSSSASLPILLTLVVFAASPAYAQNAPAGFNELAGSIVKLLQGIGITISAIGFIVAGIKYNSGDPSAKDQAKNAVIGSALIAGAVVLASFVKGFFT